MAQWIKDLPHTPEDRVYSLRTHTNHERLYMFIISGLTHAHLESGDRRTPCRIPVGQLGWCTQQSTRFPVSMWKVRTSFRGYYPTSTSAPWQACACTHAHTCTHMYTHHTSHTYHIHTSLLHTHMHIHVCTHITHTHAHTLIHAHTHRIPYT